jgi:hypothetical protein
MKHYIEHKVFNFFLYGLVKIEGLNVHDVESVQSKWFNNSL